MTTDAETCLRIMRGESPAALIAEGVMTGQGAPEVVAGCLAVFKPPPAAAAVHRRGA